MFYPAFHWTAGSRRWCYISYRGKQGRLIVAGALQQAMIRAMMAQLQQKLTKLAQLWRCKRDGDAGKVVGSMVTQVDSIRG